MESQQDSVLIHDIHALTAKYVAANASKTTRRLKVRRCQSVEWEAIIALLIRYPLLTSLELSDCSLTELHSMALLPALQ